MLAPLLGLLLSPAFAADRFASERRLEAKNERFELFEVTFPSPLPGPVRANNTVWAHFYLPAGAARPPCVLVLPIMAGPNLWVETRFAESFLRRGLAVLIVELPFQFHRKPDPLIPNGEALLARKPERMRKNFQQAVADARRAVTWLERSGEVDAGRLGLFGVSFGAVVGSSVYSQDPRLKAGVFLLGGADIPDLLAHSSETREVFSRLGLGPGALRGVFRGIDAIDYREANRGKRALLINALWDSSIPRANALALARAFPDGRQIWVPSGHYSAMLHLFWVRPYVARRLKAWLGGL